MIADDVTQKVPLFGTFAHNFCVNLENI